MHWRLMAVAALALAGGCARQETRREEAAVQAAASTGSGLFALPNMRSGRVHRERGSALMESAYGYRDPLLRENAFDRAWKEYKAAQDDYHAALVVAQPRFRPSIDEEIDRVAGLMRQIQRDRETKLD